MKSGNWMPTEAVDDRNSDDGCEGSSAGGPLIAGANGLMKVVEDGSGT